MEITIDGILGILRQQPISPVLKVENIMNSEGRFQVVLGDYSEKMLFSINEEIALPFATSEISVNDLIQVLDYQQQSLTKIEILSLKTQNGDIHSHNAASQYVPICLLNVHNPDFTIKARVLKKFDIKYMQNRNRSRSFSLQILDRDRSETIVNIIDPGVDDLYYFLDEGKIYSFSGGKLTMNPRNTGQSLFISFNNQSSIRELPEDNTIEKISLKPIGIGEIGDRPLKSKVDVAGIILSCSPIRNISGSQDRSSQLRTLEIADKSGYSIKVKLWNQHASNPELNHIRIDRWPILIMKNAQIDGFNGICLSASNSFTKVYLNPVGTHHYEKLHHFAVLFNITPQDMTPLSVNRERTIVIKPISHVLQSINKSPSWFFNILARISFINQTRNDSILYESCEECKKKVEVRENRYYCPRCDKETSSCIYRYCALLKLTDASGYVYAKVYGDAGEKIFKKSALEMKLVQENDPSEYEMLLRRAYHQEFVFEVKLAENNQTTNSVLINKVRIVNPTKIAKSLLRDISNYRAFS